MLWLLFIVISAFFGFNILQLLKSENHQFFLTCSISWLIGSMISSFIIFIFHFLLPLNAFLTILTMLVETITILLINKTKKQKINISAFKRIFLFESENKLYYLLFFIASITTLNLYISFSHYPKSLPRGSFSYIETELSFIESTRKGINRRRKHPFFYQDPLNNQQYFSTSSIPLLFVSALDSLGCGYIESSVIISFLNILSTIISIFYYSRMFKSDPFIVSLTYLLNSGWSFFRYFYGEYNCKSRDYIHDICGRTYIPWHSLIGFFMIYSKEASFSIPLSLFTCVYLLYNKSKSHLKSRLYICAGILASLIPSPGVSICTFLLGSCFPSSFGYFMPFSLSIIPKLIGLRITYYPLWREYQMNGVFFAPIVLWFNQFGPTFFSMIFPSSALYSPASLHEFLSNISSFLLMNFFRIGNGHFENIIGIMAVTMPMASVYFVDFLDRLITLAQNPLKKGVTKSLVAFIFVSYVLGGVLVMFSISTNYATFMKTEDFKLANWISNNVKSDELIVADSYSLNPAAVLTGRQILCGDLKVLFYRSSNVTESLKIIRTIERTREIMTSMKLLNGNYFMAKNRSRLDKIAQNRMNNLSLIYNNKIWTVYTIKK